MSTLVAEPPAAPAGGDSRLTDSGLVAMALFPPAAEVAAYVTTFFTMRCDEAEIRDVQPSSVGIVATMARGSGHIRFLDGRVDPSRVFTLMTPTSAAATFEVEGPWHVFGAVLSPLGWAALTGLSAAEHGNRLYDGADVLGPGFAQAARSVAEDFDRLAPGEMIARYSAAILAEVRPVPAGHARFLKAVAEWLAPSLSPDLADLVAASGYSGRQVQRLTDRYFGLPAVALARKYRALRAAVLLSRPDATPDQVAAVQDHFYDQPHMIREMRLFAGRTPARIADPDTPYLSAIMDLRHFRAIGPRMAPIPDDLRA
jgi:AraC-like DNA-binding protein